MTSTGHPATTPRAASRLTPVLALVLTLVLAVTCGSGSPAAENGPRTAAPSPRVQAAAPTPYETVPWNDGELTAATSRAAARHHGRRRATHPRRTTPCHAGPAELPPVPVLLEPRTPADGGTRARRHHPHGPDAARTCALAPPALQVFRC
ncbi:hypothetical protein [Streptomyces sp. NPDC056069]|uniref:hypothetical protein n=1 Tax=Streptomyces sp. NPDC056069 TaxID=3345702 RepID=UPI0035E08E21